ncbi:MAG: response regulator, partial [Firmicutes bacterium]|nr:response regulator [Bacillota bacterium]
METRLLLVEDDAFLRDGLCEMLRREGYAVDCAESCREARRLVTENSYRLIILDIMLPDGSGLDLCTAWRSSGCHTPILFLTARDEEVEIVRG